MRVTLSYKFDPKRDKEKEIIKLYIHLFKTREIYG